jgi:hypothetical protein
VRVAFIYSIGVEIEKTNMCTGLQRQLLIYKSASVNDEDKNMLKLLTTVAEGTTESVYRTELMHVYLGMYISM